MPVPSTRKESVPLSNVERAAEIFAEYGDFILGVIHRQTSNHAQADDLFQNFFLSLIYRPVPPDVQNVKSYLYRAITNDIADAFRWVKKYQAQTHRYAECLKYFANEDNPGSALVEAEETDRMFKLIKRRLPHSEAQAISLRYKNGYNIKEIAKEMDVKNRTISRYISVGLKKIRRFLIVKHGKGYPE